MNRIDKLFKSKREGILNIYFTAGFPRLNQTAEIIKYLAEAGVDMIEIGIPFSDSLADGPTIQQSNEKALANGMNLKIIFEQLKNIRQSIDIPLILMGSLNPIMQFGINEFCKKCKETGIDGVIIPDLPFSEYIEDYKKTFDKYGIYNIFLITPQTSGDRIKKTDTASKGFIYMVSSSSTTGIKSKIEKSQEEYFKRINRMNLKNPKLIGFGISDNKSFLKACQYANGVVIGSAFIKALSSSKANLKTTINNFVNEIKRTNCCIV
ncbi:MAG: tryptophan synthase subunit alpha [Bacteroidales bacterium]|nr:tryptophan synthase subunit alpha [Bacteroidales bacterium]